MKYTIPILILFLISAFSVSAVDTALQGNLNFQNRWTIVNLNSSLYTISNTSVDSAYWQRRVSQACTFGISTINSDGSNTCATSPGWSLTSTLVSLISSANNVSAGTLFLDNTNHRVSITIAGDQNPMGLLDVGGGSTSAITTTTGDGYAVEFNGYIDSPFLSVGEQRNQFFQTEDLSQAANWTRINVTSAIVSNSALDPTGTALAEFINAGNSSIAGIQQYILNSSTGMWTASIWLRSNTTALPIQLCLLDEAEPGTCNNLTLTSRWRRYAVTANLTQAHSNLTFIIYHGNTSAIAAWGAQLEPLDHSTSYTGAITTGPSNVVNRNFRVREPLTLLSSMSMNGAITGATTIAASSTITGSRTSTGATYVPEFIHTFGTTATIALTQEYSPSTQWIASAWSSTAAAAKTNAMEMLVIVPNNISYTYPVLVVHTTTINGVANASDMVAFDGNTKNVGFNVLNISQINQRITVNGSVNVSNKIYLPNIPIIAGHTVCRNDTDGSFFVNTTCP